MENLLTVVILLVIALNSKGNQLTHLMVIGCLMASVIETANIDIALYYALNLILLSFLAQQAIKLRSTSSLLYAIIMIIQMCICLALFTDWGESLNDTIQTIAIFITDKVSILTIVLAIAGSDNIISKAFNGTSNEAKN